MKPGALQTLAGGRALRALLTDSSSPLAKYEFRLFVYDKDENQLLPIWERRSRVALKGGL